jgi:SAM-dependent methyltransferase
MKQPADDLTTYYAQRAAEYESIYAKPERQSDLKVAVQILQDIFRGKVVLEIACGTGYWTQFIARSANQINATDINESVLEIARSKEYPSNNVQFSRVDLYDIQADPCTTALFAGFIWSHIKLEQLEHFIDKLNSLVLPGGMVVIMDNLFVPGSSTPIAERDAMGNTFQHRHLKLGDSFLVLKNFPQREELEALLNSKGKIVQYIALQYFWICVYQPILE